MIRITELSLPWGDPTEARTRDALRRAILKRLGLREGDLVDFSVFKRSHDARRKDRELAFVYIVDVAVRDEARVLAAHHDDRQVMPSPDTDFHPPPRSAGAWTTGRWWSASVPAGYSRRWCWRSKAIGRSCSNAAAMCGGARRTPGACGASGR